MSTLFYYGEADSVMPEAFKKIGLSFEPADRSKYLTKKEYNDGLAWHFCVEFPSYKKEELVATIRELYKHNEYVEDHSEIYIQEDAYSEGSYYTLNKE